jgi:hypothetical protein
MLLPDMAPAEDFHVWTHELAHSRLHFSSRRVDTTKCIRETEAEAVAFGDKDTLAQSLQHIEQMSADILSGITPP